jgi:Protein of unknown function (DUF3168).
MGVLQVNLWNAVYTRLTSAGDFNTALGGRIYYGIAPEAPQLPYAVVTFIDDVPFNVFDFDGYQTRMQVVIFGEEASGPRSVMDIADDLRVRLQRVTFAVVDHDAVITVFDIQRGPVLDDQLWRVDADYILRGLESGS